MMMNTDQADYGREIASQAAAWKSKTGLRAVYHHWFQRIVEQLGDQHPVVEIGAGCGNFKRFFPRVYATDVYASGDWIDARLDARSLPLADASVGGLVLVDCLHHLPRPIDFLQRAARSLKPGGRIVLLEPAATAWARLVWRLCHHEPVDLRADLFADYGAPEPANEGFSYANMGTAHLLFARGRQRLESAIPTLRMILCRWSDVLVYPLTGGFSYSNLLPARWTATLHCWEEQWLPMSLRPWLALRMMVVLERRA